MKQNQISSPNKKQQRDYFLRQNVNQMMEEAVAQVLQTMPGDPVQFLADYFRSKAQPPLTEVPKDVETAPEGDVASSAPEPDLPAPSSDSNQAEKRPALPSTAAMTAQDDMSSPTVQRPSLHGMTIVVDAAPTVPATSVPEVGGNLVEVVTTTDAAETTGTPTDPAASSSAKTKKRSTAIRFENSRTPADHSSSNISVVFDGESSASALSADDAAAVGIVVSALSVPQIRSFRQAVQGHKGLTETLVRGSFHPSLDMLRGSGDHLDATLDIILADDDGKSYNTLTFADVGSLGPSTFELAQLVLKCCGRFADVSTAIESPAMRSLDDVLATTAADLLVSSWPCPVVFDKLPSILVGTMMSLASDGSEELSSVLLTTVSQLCALVKTMIWSDIVPMAALRAKLQEGLIVHLKTHHERQTRSNVSPDINRKLSSYVLNPQPLNQLPAEDFVDLLEFYCAPSKQLLLHDLLLCDERVVNDLTLSTVLRKASELFAMIVSCAKEVVEANGKKGVLAALDAVETGSNFAFVIGDDDSHSQLFNAAHGHQSLPVGIVLPQNLLYRACGAIRNFVKGSSSIRRTHFLLSSCGIYTAVFPAFASALSTTAKTLVAKDDWNEDHIEVMLSAWLTLLYADICTVRLDVFGQTASDTRAKQLSSGEATTVGDLVATASVSPPEGPKELTAVTDHQKAIREINRLRTLQTAFQDKPGTLFWDVVATHRDETLSADGEAQLFRYAEWNYLQLADNARPDKVSDWKAFVSRRVELSLREGIMIEEFGRLSAAPLGMLLTVEERPAGLDSSASAASQLPLPPVYFVVLSIAETCFAAARERLRSCFRLISGPATSREVASAAQGAYTEWLAKAQPERSASVRDAVNGFLLLAPLASPSFKLSKPPSQRSIGRHNSDSGTISDTPAVSQTCETVMHQAISSVLRKLSRSAGDLPLPNIVDEYLATLAAIGVADFFLAPLHNAIVTSHPPSADDGELAAHPATTLSWLGALCAMRSRQVLLGEPPIPPLLRLSREDQVLCINRATLTVQNSIASLGINSDQFNSADFEEGVSDSMDLFCGMFLSFGGNELSHQRRRSSFIASSKNTKQVDEKISRLLYFYGFSRQSLQWLAQAIAADVFTMDAFSALPSAETKLQSLFSILSVPEEVERRYTPRLSSLLTLATKFAGVDPQALKTSQREVLGLLDGLTAQVSMKVAKNCTRALAAHSSRSIAMDFGSAIRAAVQSRRRTLQVHLRQLCAKLAARGHSIEIVHLSLRTLLDGTLQTQKSKMAEQDAGCICNAIQRLYERLSQRCCVAPATFASPTFLTSPVDPTVAAMSVVQPEAQFIKFCSSQLSKELWGIPLVNVLACFVALRQDNLPPTDQALESMQAIFFRALTKLCLSNQKMTVEELARQGDDEVRAFLFFMILLSCGGSRGVLMYLNYFGDFFVSSMMAGPHDASRNGESSSPTGGQQARAVDESLIVSSPSFERFAGVYSNVVTEVLAFVGATLEPDVDAQSNVASALPEMLGASLSRSSDRSTSTANNVKARYGQLFSEAKFASLMYSLLGVMSPNSSKKIAPVLVSTSMEQYWRSLAMLSFEYHLNGTSLLLLDQLRDVLEGTGNDLVQSTVFLLSSLNEMSYCSTALHDVLCMTPQATNRSEMPKRGDEGFEIFKCRSAVVGLLRTSHALIHEIEEADKEACATAMTNKKEILANMALINDSVQFQGLVFDERMPIHLYPLLKKPLLSFATEMAKLISSMVSSYGAPDSDASAGQASTPGPAATSSSNPLGPPEIEKGNSFRTRSFRSFVFSNFSGAEAYIPHFAGIVWTSAPIDNMQLQGLVPRDLTLLTAWVRQFFSEAGGTGPSVNTIGNKRRLSLKKVTALLKQNSAVILWRSFTRTVYSLLRDRLVESMTVREEEKAECYQIFAKTQNIVFLGLQKIDALSKVSLADEWQSAALIPALALVDDHDLAVSSSSKPTNLLPSTVLQGIFLDVYNNATSSLTRAFMNIARFSSMLSPKQVDVLGRHIYATLVADRMQDVSTLFRLTVSEIGTVQSVWASCTGKSRMQFESEFSRFLDLQPGLKPALLFATLNDLVGKSQKIFFPNTFFSTLLLETIELNSESENCLFEHLSNCWGPCAHAILLACRACGATKPQLVVLLKFLRTVRTIIRFVSALRRSPDLAAHLRYLPLKSLRAFFSTDGQRNQLVANAQTLSNKVDHLPSRASASPIPSAGNPHVGLVMHQATVVLSALEGLMRELLTVPDGDIIKTFSETVQDSLLGELTKTQLGKVFTLLCNVMAQQPTEATYCDAEAARSLLCAVFISVRQHDALRDQLRLPPPTSQVGAFTVQWPCLPALTEAFEGISREQRDKVGILVKNYMSTKLRFAVDSRQKMEAVNTVVAAMWSAIYAGATQFAGNVADVAAIGLLQPLQPAVSVLTERELRETCAVMIQALLDEGGKQSFFAPREALLHFVAAVLRSVRNYCATGDTTTLVVEDTAYGDFPMAEFKIMAFVWLSVLEDISEIYPIAAFLYKKAFQQRIVMEQQQKQQSGGIPESSHPGCQLAHFSSFLGLVHKISDDVARNCHSSDDVQKAIGNWVETLQNPPQQAQQQGQGAQQQPADGVEATPFPFRTVISCGTIALVGALEKSSSMAAARVFGPCAKLAVQKALFYVETVSWEDDDTMSSSGSRRSSTASASLDGNDDLGGSASDLTKVSAVGGKVDALPRSPSTSSTDRGKNSSGLVTSPKSPSSQNTKHHPPSLALTPSSIAALQKSQPATTTSPRSNSGSFAQQAGNPLGLASPKSGSKQSGFAEAAQPVVNAVASPKAVVTAQPTRPVLAPEPNRPQLPSRPILVAEPSKPISPPAPTKPAEPTKPTGFTLQQVAQHKTRSDCWVAVRGKVYDVTKLISTHPGGSGAILGAAGKDGTSTFFENHDSSSSAHKKIQSYFIGDLVQ